MGQTAHALGELRVGAMGVAVHEGGLVGGDSRSPLDPHADALMARRRSTGTRSVAVRSKS